MRRAITVQEEVGQIATIEELTGVFENLASMKLSHIKNQVVSATQFFNELWQIYIQLRRDPREKLSDNFGTTQADPAKAQRTAFIIITSEAGLSGDIDDRIVAAMRKQYDPNTCDVIVIGGHGANLLSQHRIPIIKLYRLPEANQRVDVTPIIKVVEGYKSTLVFYETYQSLGVQGVATRELVRQVRELGTVSGNEGEIISSRDYLFEPSFTEVIAFMESVMLAIALSQMILESKLAQYASRFNAMSAAKTKARDMKAELTVEYHRVKRATADERMKEVTSVMDGES